MQRFRRAAKLKSVAAFTRDVFDSETMLFDLLPYQGVLMNGWMFATAIKRACEALRGFGLRGERAASHHMVRVF